VVKQVLQTLTFERAAQNEVVFNIDEKGDKFYIVLEGEVAIMTPKRINDYPAFNSEDMEEFLEFLADNYDLIYWNN